MTSVAQTTRQAVTLRPLLRQVVLASVMSVSAAVVLAGSAGTATGAVIGAAVGAVTLVLAGLQARRAKLVKAEVPAPEMSADAALQLFAASLAYTQREKQGFIMPEHDMRSDEQKVQSDEANADLNAYAPDLHREKHESVQQEEICTIRVTHPYASSMVH